MSDETRSEAQALADRYDAGDRDVMLMTFASRRSALRFAWSLLWHVLSPGNPVAPKRWNDTIIGKDGSFYWTHLLPR